MKFTNGAMAKVYKIYTFLIYIIPMIGLYVWKHEDFGTEGSIFGFWGIVVIFLMVIAFKQFCADFFKKFPQLSVSLIILFIGLFSEFLADNLVLIGSFSTVASILGLLFSTVADVYQSHAFLIDKATGEKRLNKNKAISQKEAWQEAYFFGIAEEVEETEQENE